MARNPMVARKELLIKMDSYFKCMKNRSTNDALMEAMNRAAHMFKTPRFILETKTVTTVKASRVMRTVKRRP